MNSNRNPYPPELNPGDDPRLDPDYIAWAEAYDRETRAQQNRDLNRILTTHYDRLATAIFDNDPF